MKVMILGVSSSLGRVSLPFLVLSRMVRRILFDIGLERGIVVTRIVNMHILPL